jgi:nicotinamidase-related amidase
VNDASRILPKINSIRAEKDCLFDLVVRSQDFHPSGHISWASSNFVSDLPVGTPIPVKCIKPSDGRTADAACCADSEGTVDGQPVDLALKLNLTEARTTQASLGNPACDICFNESSASECYETVQAMWPDHCPQTGDSTFPPSLITKETDVIVQKGLHQWVDAYSAFFDNTRNLKTPLEGVLKEHNITHLYVAGIATDFCVFWSATDAVDLGYSVTLIQDASAGIGIPTTGNDTTITEAIADMKAKGVKFMNTADLLDIPCASETTTTSESATTSESTTTSEITTTTTSSAAHAPMFLVFFLIAAGLATPY